MSCRKLIVKLLPAVIALVILMAAGSSRLAVAQETSCSGTDAEGYDGDICYTIESLDRFWAKEFATLGLTYQPPDGPYPYDARVPPEGPCYAAGLNALYCRLNDAIYFEEPNMLRPWHADYGDFAPLFVLAHEWGHAIQERMDLLGDASVLNIDKELQADCFAGAWAQYLENGDEIYVLEEGDVDEALTGLLELRDSVGLPWVDSQAHGTAFQRIEAFLMGYRGGRPRCFDPMPAPSKPRTR
jgi:predicted metalloprotease